MGCSLSIGRCVVCIVAWLMIKTPPGNHCDSDGGSNMLWQWLPRAHSGRKQEAADALPPTSRRRRGQTDIRQISGLLRRTVAGVAAENISAENQKRKTRRDRVLCAANATAAPGYCD